MKPGLPVFTTSLNLPPVYRFAVLQGRRKRLPHQAQWMATRWANSWYLHYLPPPKITPIPPFGETVRTHAWFSGVPARKERTQCHARGPPPRPPARGWGWATRGRAPASRNVGGRSLHRDADAQPARLRARGVARGPFGRRPTVARHRDRRRADGYVRQAVGAAIARRRPTDGASLRCVVNPATGRAATSPGRRGSSVPARPSRSCASGDRFRTPETHGVFANVSSGTRSLAPERFPRGPPLLLRSQAKASSRVRLISWFTHQ